MKLAKKVSVGCAVALALTLGVSTQAPTALARTITGDIADLKIEDIQCENEGSITVIKKPHGIYSGISLDKLPEGIISGSVFEVTRVSGIDLTTKEGWDRASSITLEEAKKQLENTTQKATTNREGRATFSGLTQGLYLVHEVGPAQKHRGFWSSQDMLVTVPTGGPSGWDCGVEIITKDRPNDPDIPDPPTTVTTTRVVPPSPPASTVPQPDPQPTTSVPDKSKTQQLARTGASVISILILAGALIALGAWLVRRNRRDNL
ncbi:surface-anchored fimbrial subunit [Corynebacterium kutscheri]|uniref:Gram-positive pilin subunit D1 N-terminal domain-containing protein n=1 Tax=Corynebacterium kutscheri TaxID=35755 RepID=A0A0F6R087_9CORY|nr:SpaA isopeptide-forming pilin-related protein [Corynebacterium kutscheri]AKE40288.1 hypothetical protein UL82_00225 [Corynebacterium kutscheri]VEH10680.1 surface-anchored fimbrial subunit [Corynebacterium kutscheri]VEH81403.1 surface-anchored fimbrial subunit [Corynebacterium kutscheri]